jgi:hypothetical protein
MHKPSNVRRAVCAGLVLSIAPSVSHANTTVLTCTNPSSGTTWDVAVDFDRRMADSFPADISDSSIAWQDSTHGGIYEFDRASGVLTFRNASSTGGYFLHDQCREHP